MSDFKTESSTHQKTVQFCLLRKQIAFEKGRQRSLKMLLLVSILLSLQHSGFLSHGNSAIKQYACQSKHHWYPRVFRTGGSQEQLNLQIHRSEPSGHRCWTFPTAAAYPKATSWLAMPIYRKVERGREENLKSSLPGIKGEKMGQGRWD